MRFLDEAHVSLFLIQVLVLLVTAKVLGALCVRRGIPALVGEIVAGVLLGPTILGRFVPGIHNAIFPQDAIQVTMLETISWFGVLFLLLSTGFEINVSTVWKQGKAAVSIGVLGVIIPILLGCSVFYWLPSSYWGANANHLTFTAFLATAASITGLSVVARLLHDMDILKSDLGTTSLSACVVNDVFGWLVFALVLAMAEHTHIQIFPLLKVILGIVLFGAFGLTLGSRAVGAVCALIKRSALPLSETVLALIVCVGVLCGAVTNWIGIHAILGFFLAGIMIGNAREISEHTRETLSQTIHAVFVPLFFAGIGLKVDFLAGGDPFVIVVFTVVALAGKFLGAWTGARLVRLPKSDALSVGILFIPGGAMEIVVGVLALEMQLITVDLFVAIVFAALFTSVIAGPLTAWSIRRRGIVDVKTFLIRDAIRMDLNGTTPSEIIEEMAAKLAECTAVVDRQTLIDAVLERESIMSTGLERGVAVPHARLPQLRRPMIAYGRSLAGVYWDARDGNPIHSVFLVLTPQTDYGAQVQILASIARLMTRPDISGSLMLAVDEGEAFKILRQNLASPKAG